MEKIKLKQDKKILLIGSSVYEDEYQEALEFISEYKSIYQMYFDREQVEYADLPYLNVDGSINLNNYDKYHVICKKGTDIYFERCADKIYRETGTVEDKVAQIPGGKVFFTIDNCCSMLWSSSLEKEIFIRNGNALIKGKEYVICEFGMGINEKMKYIKQLTISEKAYGTCHFGLGNNIAFGGRSDCNYHFNITISALYLGI